MVKRAVSIRLQPFSHYSSFLIEINKRPSFAGYLIRRGKGGAEKTSLILSIFNRGLSLFLCFDYTQCELFCNRRKPFITLQS
jgi:hypothetical protein